MRQVVFGALAGLAATIPMTIAMEMLWRRLPPQERYPLPPREIIDRVLPARAGAALTDDGCRHATITAHFGYGAVTAGLFPLITDSRAAASGAAYRIAVSAFRHPPRRNALMIAVHLIWGASKAIALREIDREAAPGRARSRPSRRASRCEVSPQPTALSFMAGRNEPHQTTFALGSKRRKRVAC